MPNMTPHVARLPNGEDRQQTTSSDGWRTGPIKQHRSGADASGAVSTRDVDSA